MNALFTLIAQTAPATPPPGGGSPPGWATFLNNPLNLILIFGVIFYFLMLRPKQAEARQRKEMLASLKRNDRIQTIGGVLGTVVEVRDDEVVIKVDESNNTKVHFTRSAIHRVITGDGDKEKKGGQ